MWVVALVLVLAGFMLKHLGVDNIPIAVFVAIGVVVCCVVYTKAAAAQEGFVAGKSPKDVLDCLKNLNSALSDDLVISKYRQNYEDSVVQLKKWTNLTILKNIATNKLCDPDSAKAMQTVNDINALRQMEANLDKITAFLDSA
jgi:hypothetical protein